MSNIDQVAWLKIAAAQMKRAHKTVWSNTCLESAAEIERLTALLEHKPDDCLWAEAGPDYNEWDTECGEAYCFLNDGPHENGLRFCGYCGGKLITKGTDRMNQISGASTKPA